MNGMLFHCWQFIELYGKMVLPSGQKLMLLYDCHFVVKGLQLFWVVHSWFSHSSLALVKKTTFRVIRVCTYQEFSRFYQLPFIFELSECLLSKLFLAEFFLVICSSVSLLLPSNQFSCFLLQYTIDLKAFHFSSIVPARISISLSFSEACGSSPIRLSLIVLITSFLRGILSFFILRLNRSLVGDLISTAVDSSHCSCVQMIQLLVLGSWLHSEVLVDLFVLEEGVIYDRLVFCADG